MLAKTIRHLLPFIAVVYFSTNSLRADEALAPLADPANALKALQSKIDALRKEGKTYEADQLEVKRSKAVLRVAGVQAPVMPELHAELPENDLPKVIQPRANPAKEERVRSLLAAASSLKAAGLEEDAARYERLASQLAKNDDSVEVIRLRDEVAELKSEVEHLRKEIEGIAGRPLPCGPVPQLAPATGRLQPAPVYYTPPPSAGVAPTSPVPGPVPVQ